MKCGFIGLGSQGGPMARRIVEGGYDLVLWARRSASLEPYADTNANYANSVAELGEQVDFCGVCVVDDSGVKDVVGQLLPVMSEGSVIAIHSTITPSLCVELAGQASERGISLVDAPVSGGGPAAAAGTLAVMMGGDREAAKKVQPIFDTFASSVTHLGDVGAGQNAKLVNNTLMTANLTVAHLSLAIADALGIEADAFKELVKISSGRSFAFDVRARMARARDFKHGAQLLQKDVNLLGDTVPAKNADYEAIRDIANQFLSAALIK